MTAGRQSRDGFHTTHNHGEERLELKKRNDTYKGVLKHIQESSEYQAMLLAASQKKVSWIGAHPFAEVEDAAHKVCSILMGMHDR